MDCARIDLVAYHVDLASPDERDRAERHLVECKACLEEYLALKRATRALSRGSAASSLEGPRPGPAARERLRRDVARRFAPRRARLVAWLVRPVPLYQGVAATAVVLLAVAVAGATLRASPRSAKEEAARIDTARPAAESLSIY